MGDPSEPHKTKRKREGDHETEEPMALKGIGEELLLERWVPTRDRDQCQPRERRK